jgi:TonB family protein
MRISHLLKCTLAVGLAFLPVPLPTRSQEKAISSPASVAEASKYSDTKAGLQRFLNDIREAAKANDSQKMTALVKDTEIPNCDAWLHAMYESDKADSWMDLCDAKTLGSNEKSLIEHFTDLVKADGEFLTRKVNDDPEPGRGVEWGWLQAIRRPLDIYFASWKTAGSTTNEPIGYFMFIDGGFRWDSGIKFINVKPKVGKFVPAKLVRKVDPVYPAEAAAQHIGGTVRVSVVIGADGLIHSAHAISGEGLSDDPGLRKAAEDAVSQWLYTPATVDGKPLGPTNATTSRAASDTNLASGLRSLLRTLLQQCSVQSLHREEKGPPTPYGRLHADDGDVFVMGPLIFCFIENGSGGGCYRGVDARSESFRNRQRCAAGFNDGQDV